MSTKHIHILGICGTFMGGLARLARELGYTVTVAIKMYIRQ
jgi:UDP-N-acetylmuramate: L-alanyl-gamma-D-glutamyl-meso-diaminopimelate ligase